MDISKQEYLQNVLETHKMSHIEKLIDKYKTKRNEVKEAIEEHYSSDIYNPINSGSFAKHTAINTKFDLDIVVPFKRNSFSTLKELFDDVYDFLDDKYGDIATVRKQKVSIGIEFYADDDGDEISLDIVPGRELNQDDYPNNKDLNLFVRSKFGLLEPNTHIKTNIQAQIDHIKAKENERKVIRLLKIWKSSNSKKYKSFLIELFTIKAFEKENISGNLWNKLKGVMEYIKENATKDGFTLKDPGNSNNNVMDTLDEYERESLSNDMKNIIDNIESYEDNIKTYFPLNKDFESKLNNSDGYGLKSGVAGISTPPKIRFGIK